MLSDYSPFASSFASPSRPLVIYYENKKQCQNQTTRKEQMCLDKMDLGSDPTDLGLGSDGRKLIYFVERSFVIVDLDLILLDIQ